MFHGICRAAPGVVCVLLLAQWGLAAEPVPPLSPVQINYELSSLGANRWQYTYGVANHAWPQPISQFTIWFDPAAYRNLTIGTANPPAGNWSELVAQPNALFQLDGFYDALSLTGGITAGNAVSGFTVAFDWLGVGQPGVQRFEIINPADSGTLYSGLTVPEPVSAMLVLATLLVPRRRGRR